MPDGTDTDTDTQLFSYTRARGKFISTPTQRAAALRVPSSSGGGVMLRGKHGCQNLKAHGPWTMGSLSDGRIFPSPSVASHTRTNDMAAAGEARKLDGHHDHMSDDASSWPGRTAKATELCPLKTGGCQSATSRAPKAPKSTDARPPFGPCDHQEASNSISSPGSRDQTIPHASRTVS